MAWVEELPPDNDGVIRYRGVYRTADKRKRSKTFDHERAALRWASAREEEVADGSRHDPAKGKMRWGQWCAQWWPTRRLEHSTAAQQASLRDNHIKPHWRDVPLRDIDRLDVQAWVNGLTPGLSASAARQC